MNTSFSFQPLSSTKVNTESGSRPVGPSQPLAQMGAQTGGHQHLGVVGGVQAAGQQQGAGGEGDCFQHGRVPC